MEIYSGTCSCMCSHVHVLNLSNWLCGLNFGKTKSILKLKFVTKKKSEEPLNMTTTRKARIRNTFLLESITFFLQEKTCFLGFARYVFH